MPTRPSNVDAQAPLDEMTMTVRRRQGVAVWLGRLSTLPAARFRRIFLL
jgi:hypothetical protein